MYIVYVDIFKFRKLKCRLIIIIILNNPYKIIHIIMSFLLVFHSTTHLAQNQQLYNINTKIHRLFRYVCVCKKTTILYLIERQPYGVLLRDFLFQDLCRYLLRKIKWLLLTQILIALKRTLKTNLVFSW